MKNILILFTTLFFTFNSQAALIQVDFEASIEELYIARPDGTGGWSFERDITESDKAGTIIRLGDSIKASLVYDASVEEMSYSHDESEYAAYWSLRSFNINIGDIALSNPDDEDYLAIYNNGLFSNIDAFYTSGSYRDAFNFNIFRVHLFADNDLWDSTEMPESLELSDFYYKSTAGAFLPENEDLHLNWRGEIRKLSTQIIDRDINTIPEPSLIVLLSTLLFRKRLVIPTFH